MKSYKIHESSNKPTDFLLVEISGVLWSIWAEGKNFLLLHIKNNGVNPLNIIQN